MRAQYLTYTNLVIIVVDIERTTPEYIIPWINDVHAHAGEKVPFVIALNKIDLIDPVQIEKVRQEMEKTYKVKVYPTSAKTGANITEMFEYIADHLLSNNN